MSKKYFLFLIIFVAFAFVQPQVFADEAENIDSEWSEMLEFDRSWRTNHEAVTDSEFEKVMQRFEKKKKYKKYEFEPNESKDSLNDMSILKEIANYSPILLFQTNLRTYEGDYIPAGHYKLNLYKQDGNYYIALTQSREVFARIKMNLTAEDFESDEIQFAEIQVVDNEKMRLIYGNLDINLEKILYIVN